MLTNTHRQEPAVVPPPLVPSDPPLVICARLTLRTERGSTIPACCVQYLSPTTIHLQQPSNRHCGLDCFLIPPFVSGISRSMEPWSNRYSVSEAPRRSSLPLNSICRHRCTEPPSLCASCTAISKSSTVSVLRSVVGTLRSDRRHTNSCN